MTVCRKGLLACAAAFGRAEGLRSDAESISFAEGREPALRALVTARAKAAEALESSWIAWVSVRLGRSDPFRSVNRDGGGSNGWGLVAHGVVSQVTAPA